MMEMTLSLLDNGSKKMEVEGQEEEEDEQNLFVAFDQDGEEGGVAPGEQLVQPYIPRVLEYLDLSIQQPAGGKSAKCLNLQFILLSR